MHGAAAAVAQLVAAPGWQPSCHAQSKSAVLDQMLSVCVVCPASGCACFMLGVCLCHQQNAGLSRRCLFYTVFAHGCERQHVTSLIGATPLPSDCHLNSECSTLSTPLFLTAVPGVCLAYSRPMMDCPSGLCLGALSPNFKHALTVYIT